jgi:group I intron endonuclease
MYYLVYKITNTLNGKTYIGCHKTKDKNDGYMGSGKHIKRAINKYGVDNFTKEIIAECSCSEEMFAKEKELVVLDEMSYNMKVGGEGGFDYLNNTGLNTSWKDKQERNSKISKAIKDKWESDPTYAKALRERLGVRTDNFIESAKVSFLGKEHTDETKEKIRKSVAGKHVGVLNSQHGTMWITNGVSNKKIDKTDLIPEGWRRGRVL